MSMEPPELDLGHPDATIRLTSAIHRFKVPKMTRTVSFSKSFETVGKHSKTKAVMKKADDARKKLDDSLGAASLSGERVFVDATRYLPLIHQILLTCKVQPEMARLDERLIFEYKSGMEKEPERYSSEALMYDMVMTIASQGLAKAATATEASVAGEFAGASREYCAAAGIFQFLADDHLPKWAARGSQVDADALPTEATVGPCQALVELFLANAQQMAVATVLMKPGTPNYSLLAKLCFGIHEKLNSFLKKIRQCPLNMDRMDKDFFTILSFQTTLQQSLCGYFYARSLWDSKDYGMAIAMLSESGLLLKTRQFGKPGVPEIAKGSPLVALEKDLKDLRAHYGVLLKAWESDNSKVYFDGVPNRVPEDRKLTQPVFLSKPTPYKLDEVDPLPLQLPDGAETAAPRSYDRSDSDLARRLHEELNAGN